VTTKRQPPKERRDGNERHIIDALEAAGAFVRQMRVGAGFDLLVIYQGVTHVMEVKQPGGKLTPNEKLTQSKVIIAGGSYHIVNTIDDALEIIRERGEYEHEY